VLSRRFRAPADSVVDGVLGLTVLHPHGAAAISYGLNADLKLRQIRRSENVVFFDWVFFPPGARYKISSRRKVLS